MTLLALVLTLVTGIYQLESTSGLHDSCRLQGKYNGYGYASNKVCFNSHEEAQGIVVSWVIQQHLKGLTDAQLLCKYNTGKPLNDCDYYRKYKSL